MITLRRSGDRGHFDHGWLKTWHTFSFADYRDPRHIHFRTLRVINEDIVQPGMGFGTHPHRDMEIITYVLEGELEHRDSMGNGSIIRPGEVQYMSAGSGVTHSEFNPSKTNPVHLMQIWIFPSAKGLPPRYEQRQFPPLSNTGRMTLLASGDGRDGSIEIRQDARLAAAALRAGGAARYEFEAGRSGWLQVLRGELGLNGETLSAGDGAAIEDVTTIDLAAKRESQVLLFDLA
ncbi:MAG: pirin family protein [Phycisphaerales bacterium]|nr:pirin family protein [Phycisphaerales bacterium]